MSVVSQISRLGRLRGPSSYFARCLAFSPRLLLFKSSFDFLRADEYVRWGMPMRRFEFREGSSSKFWEVEQTGPTLHIAWGKIGTAGQKQDKTFATATEARTAHDKLVSEKVKKGYEETSSRARKKSVSEPNERSSELSKAAFGEEYLVRFRAMVDELRNDPEIQILQFEINPPAPEKELASLERSIGAPLAASLRSFYRAANGLQLRWIHRRHPSYGIKLLEKKKVIARADVFAGDTIEDGFVNLLPAHEVFDTDWKNHTWTSDMTDDDPEEFEGEAIPRLTFRKALRLFDVYSFYNLVAFYVRAGVGDPPIVFGDDHGADWSDSQNAEHGRFEDYLETILAMRGLVDRREPIHPRSHWVAQPVSLESLVDDLELTEPVAATKPSSNQKVGTQLKPTASSAIRALRRRGALTEAEVPRLVELAAPGQRSTRAAIDALASVGATSDAAVAGLVALLRNWLASPIECVPGDARYVERRRHQSAVDACLLALASIGLRASAATLARGRSRSAVGDEERREAAVRGVERWQLEPDHHALLRARVPGTVWRRECRRSSRVAKVDGGAGPGLDPWTRRRGPRSARKSRVEESSERDRRDRGVHLGIQ